ncbi:hypothetical protein [Nocardioides sp. Kera G14]|uniref:hypothetical protein n=1 Tax=Nocardioides sp. Kera G14 TaxID=2884264 RepID=UPI001D122083|nr:hypothetical protein [Nocardioides sp. Kera G14]UDY23707.1 hypothetical protein LH076_16850 [Nocardioides sp. Kera G14]
MTEQTSLSPREQLTVAAWERRRMVAALLTGDPDGPLPPFARPLVGGLAAAAVVVAVILIR